MHYNTCTTSGRLITILFWGPCLCIEYFEIVNVEKTYDIWLGYFDHLASNQARNVIITRPWSLFMYAQGKLSRWYWFLIEIASSQECSRGNFIEERWGLIWVFFVLRYTALYTMQPWLTELFLSSVEVARTEWMSYVPRTFDGSLKERISFSTEAKPSSQTNQMKWRRSS